MLIPNSLKEKNITSTCKAKSKQKNSIIPTSPIKESDQKSTQLFTKPTSNVPNPSSTLELPPLTSNNGETHNNDRVSLASTTSSMISSNSSNDLTTATALSSHTSSIQSNNVALAQLTSLMSSASHGNTNKDLVPVAFLPIGLVLPSLMQQQQQQMKYLNDEKSVNGLMKSHLSGLDNAVMNGVSPSTSIISNMSNMSSGALMMNFPTISLNDLPHVEFNVSHVDFGHIAEGCCTSMRLTLRVTPNNSSNKSKN
jgi:hypothetical protein